MIAELDHTFAPDGQEGFSGLNAVQAQRSVMRTYLWGADLSGTMTGAGGTGGLLSFTNHRDGQALTESSSYTYHVCSDANGNVTGLVPANGPDAGKLIARFDYDPFGNRITNTGPDVELCPFGFSTQYTDSETGLVAYLYRYYSPQMGRFLSRDPIGENGGINLYGLVGNDPVNRVDILGLSPLSVQDVSPNCEVLLGLDHGPGASNRWYDDWLLSVRHLTTNAALSSGNSSGLVGDGDLKGFYGSIGIMACYTPARRGWWTPDVKGNSGLTGFERDGLQNNVYRTTSSSNGTPFTNGGFGHTKANYMDYLARSWEATLKHANRLASDCSKDQCCKCRHITAIFRTTGSPGTGGPTRDSHDFRVGNDREFQTSMDQSQLNSIFPNLDNSPGPNQTTPQSIHRIPHSNDRVKFKVPGR